MNSQLNNLLARALLILIVISAGAILAVTWRFPSSARQVDERSEEREFDNRVPKHLPLKIKVRDDKVKGFKDLKNEKWLNELEIEVTNISNKPIYYLSLSLELPEMKSPNNKTIGYPIKYGRRELGLVENLASTEDIPIRPGETQVFGISQSLLRGWDLFRSQNSGKVAKKVQLVFHVLSFGDGTGFVLTNGSPFPRSSAREAEERLLDNSVPNHVPIKIKIKKEKETEFKDLNNRKWLRDFELELTNTSEKPIYFVELWVVLPEIITENGMELGFPIRYGRSDFIKLQTVAVADDVPIPPGGVEVFKIAEKYHRGWEANLGKRNHSEPTRVQIKFVQLSFGDGTGFNGTDAKPYPYKPTASP